jgi:hypothetical protein
MPSKQGMEIFGFLKANLAAASIQQRHLGQRQEKAQVDFQSRELEMTWSLL